MSSYFRTEHLSVGYNKKPVVHDISFDIQKGQVVSLIGPNGAGKSTMLKTFVRDLDIISGKIYLDGKNLLEYTNKELSKKMAVILTDRIKVELMTCRDIVATGRYPYTGRLGILSEEDNRIVEESLATVHASELAERDFNAISDGQRQRILLARALCQEPEIILLDEPTSFLDVRHKLDLLTILTRLARQKNITVIMSLHEIDLAEKVSDRIITVKGDSLFEFGAPEKIFHEENIRSLYEIDNGYFDPLFGSIELKKPNGARPKVFVIAGGGTAIPTFRKLQQENIPFAAGVLFTNDLDYQLARLLAAEVITAEPFEPIPKTVIQKALALIDACEKVILVSEIAAKPNKLLVDAALNAKKLEVLSAQ